MPLVTLTSFTEDDVIENPDVIFLYAENEAEKGGTSLVREIRGQDNAKGVRVKRASTNHASSFYSEDDYVEVTDQIDEDLTTVEDHLREGGVVITTFGMFTDPKFLENSPEIHAHVEDRLREFGKL